MADDGHENKGKDRIQDKDHTNLVCFCILDGQGKQSIGNERIQSQEQEDAPAGNAKSEKMAEIYKRQDKAAQAIRK